MGMTAHRQEAASNPASPDPGVDALSRIRTLLGGEAAQRFVPLFQKWVSSGFIGGTSFKATGDNIVAACVKHGGLQPQHRVLDIGCGIGRIALALLGHLSADGNYEGFDVIPSGINWLRRYVTVKHPRFRFRLAGRVYSGLYNPKGGTGAASYKFPYRESSFDFAIAVSVFTHMVDPAVSHYLAETARTLKPGGRLFCTAYLLDDSALASVRAARSGISFPHDFGAYRLRSVAVPESAVALDEKYFLNCAAQARLHLQGQIQRGSWRRSATETGQDLVVLEKEAD